MNDNFDKNEDEKRRIGFLDLILFPIEMIWKLLLAAFRLIGAFFKFVAIAILIFIIWFGYNSYNNYTTLSKDNNFSQDVALEALNLSLEKTKELFASPYEKASSLFFQLSRGWGSYFSSSYKDVSLREIFIEEKGIPEAYLILISYDKLTEENFPIKRDKPLFFETWIYSKPYNKKIVFENGFFLEEGRIKESDIFFKNRISPLLFTTDTRTEDIIDIFGEEACVFKEEAGGDIITTYRFEDSEEKGLPVSSVTFVNEKLISVSVGIVFLGDNEEKLCH